MLWIEILVILVLILLNGWLAMAEMGLVSARRARLQQKAGEGNGRAQAALYLLKQPSEFLSAVQIGITLVGILAGAVGGATISEFLAQALRQIPALAAYSEELAFGVVVLTITYLSLVLGELAPKRLALNNPERIAMAVARPMQRLAHLAAPVVRLLIASTNAVLRAARQDTRQDVPVTEDEIKVLIDQGTQAGVFEKVEQEMVAGVFRFADRRVGTLITPRTEIEWLDLDESVETNLRKIAESIHARFPVGRGSLDKIEGIVLAKDVLGCCLAGRDFNLTGCMIEPCFVPENMPALKVLEIFKVSSPHLVLVIDEFGGLQGLVTAQDILEAIVGDLPAPGQVDEAEIVQREDGSWLLDGMLPADEFKELFRLAKLPDERSYQTLGGFVVNYLGQIPTSGDHFEWGELRFEVMDMDGLRVDKVLVQEKPAAFSSPAKNP
ncbi:MAG: hemolysin family protein [Chloroflexota bacterium]